MIKIINKDIFEDNSAALLHCANCYNTMGAGIAAQIARVYPEAKVADLATIRGDKGKLGSFSVARCNGKSIYNLYGQYNFDRRGRNLNYEAIYSSMQLAYSDMLIKEIKTASIPFNMGCSLAGGNWDIVYSMIKVIYGGDLIDLTICKL